MEEMVILSSRFSGMSGRLPLRMPDTSNGTTSNFSSIGTLGTTVNGTSIQVVGAGAGQGGCYNAVGNAAIEL